MRILFVCTGNICRSPVAEALLRQRLAEAGVDAHVASVGTLEGGQPAAEHSVDLLAERGLDASEHRSRPMTREELLAADLIIGMARFHVREAVVAAGLETFPRAFTLKELVRRGGAVGPRRADQTLEQWLAEAHEGRIRDDLMGDSDEDDIVDPIGQPRRAYEAMVAELDDLIGRMVWLVWGNAQLSARKEPSWRA